MFHKLAVLALLLGVCGELFPVISAETTATEEQDDSSGPGCPPGYWCKKKREVDDTDCPRDFICRSKRNAEGPGCPPGYWCRRSEMVIDHETKREDCPEESWCRQSRVMISNPRSMFGRPGCPPGYWCRKKRSIELLSDRKCPVEYQCDTKREEVNDAAGPGCPPGYWCKRKRDMIENPNRNCPSGRFWCKRVQSS